MGGSASLAKRLIPAALATLALCGLVPGALAPSQADEPRAEAPRPQTSIQLAALAPSGPTIPVPVRGLGLPDALTPLPRLARSPRGYVAFCRRNPSECAPARSQGIAAAPRAAVTLTSERLAQLDAINRSVNAAVHPITDQRLYDRVELWTYPRLARLRLAATEETEARVVETLAGDCEDYVLLKRAKLLAAGWPADALLITVVRDLEGLGHAVLTVRTTEGDLILDNQAEDIAHWKATGYSFIKRQSARDPRLWVSLGTPVMEASAVGNTD